MRSLAVRRLAASGFHSSWVSIASTLDVRRYRPVLLFFLPTPTSWGTNGIWVQQRRTVLQDWAYIRFICHSLDLSVANANVASDKAQIFGSVLDETRVLIQFVLTGFGFFPISKWSNYLKHFQQFSSLLRRLSNSAASATGEAEALNTVLEISRYYRSISKTFVRFMKTTNDV